MCEVRYMLPEEQQAVEGLKGSDSIVNEFISMWTFWKNWDKHPPVIVLDGNAVVGLHAYTFTKSNYCNSYYLWLHEDYRGRKLGGAMLDVTLRHAAEIGITRLKMKTHDGSDGYAFWCGFGLKPVGWQAAKKEYIFDQDIYGIDSVTEFIDAAATWMYDPDEAQVVTEDKRTINLCLKQNVEWLNSDWEAALS